ncbi:aldo/keto reductase, partial [Actinomadura adrarensis]
LLAGNRDRGGERRTVRANTDAFAEKMYQENDFAVVDAVRAVAKERDVPLAQVALAWLLGRPGMTAPIIGASRLGHVDDAVAAVELKLDEAETERLEAPYQPHSVLGHV